MKKCPYCAEEIQDDAIVCRFCHKNLTGGGIKTALTFFAKAFFILTILVSFFLDINILFHELGFINFFIISIALSPLGWFGIPIYLVIKYQIWLPLIVTYGGFFMSIVLYILGYNPIEENTN